MSDICRRRLPVISSTSSVAVARKRLPSFGSGRTEIHLTFTSDVTFFFDVYDCEMVSLPADATSVVFSLSSTTTFDEICFATPAMAVLFACSCDTSDDAV